VKSLLVIVVDRSHGLIDACLSKDLNSYIICSYIFDMASPLFIWDEGKNLSNQRKHGLSFEVAARVFLDPLHLSVQDRIENGEQRWQTVGQIDGLAVVLVAHTFMKEEGPLD